MQFTKSSLKYLFFPKQNVLVSKRFKIQDQVHIIINIIAITKPKAHPEGTKLYTNFLKSAGSLLATVYTLLGCSSSTKQFFLFFLRVYLVYCCEYEELNIYNSE